MGEIVNVLQDTFDTMMGGVTRESERAKKEKREKKYLANCTAVAFDDPRVELVSIALPAHP